MHAANLQYNSRSWLLYWQHEYVGKNYNAEVGYVPRNGYIKLNPQAGYFFFQKAEVFYLMGLNYIILYILMNHSGEPMMKSIFLIILTFATKAF